MTICFLLWFVLLGWTGLGACVCLLFRIRNYGSTQRAFWRAFAWPLYLAPKHRGTKEQYFGRK